MTAHGLVVRADEFYLFASAVNIASKSARTRDRPAISSSRRGLRAASTLEAVGRSVVFLMTPRTRCRSKWAASTCSTTFPFRFQLASRSALERNISSLGPRRLASVKECAYFSGFGEFRQLIGEESSVRRGRLDVLLASKS